MFLSPKRRGEEDKMVGRKKGCIPWNKDKKYEETFSPEKAKELKDNMSKVHKGKKLSDNHRQILKEYNTDRAWTEERNKKVSVAKLGDKNPSKRKEVRIKISAYRQGIKIQDWDGFITEKQYDEVFKSQEFRKMIKERDFDMCILCKKIDKKNLIHHIDCIKTNSIPENCITMCRGCHNKVHGNQHRHQYHYYTEKILQEMKI